MLISIVLIMISFVLGAIPFGYIIANKSGINIQELGSGNIGSTNVARVLGKKKAIYTQLLDILKGLIPVLLATLLVRNEWVNELSGCFVLMVALAAILGHDYTPFLRFRGGKGVNTTMGASIIVAPLSAILSFLLYMLSVSIWRYASVGSIIIGVSLPLIQYLQSGFSYTFIYLLCAGVLIIIRHKQNIVRLINGKENKC